MADERLLYTDASGHPYGGRVDLCWLNPVPELFSGVRVMRRRSTHPVAPDDPQGQLVADKLNTLLFSITSSFAQELDLVIISSQLKVQFALNQIDLSHSASVTTILKGGK